MATTAPRRTLWQALTRRREQAPQIPAVRPAPAAHADVPQIDIAPDDPLLAYLQAASGPVEVARLTLDSPALRAMKAAGVRLAVPLVSQGELIGLLNLGERLSQQDYSGDDRALLANLAAQAAPAVRVAQLVRQQQAEAQERERIEQELRVARLIQQTLLPKEVPALPGWHLAAHYQPARAVGGDFYDFLALPGGRLGLVVGDVTDKGVPAALVMATTRAVLRAAAGRLDSPGAVLERVNNALCPDIPANMFVTCLYGILDPATGTFRFANAGHDLPYQRRAEGVVELRATGMPLGLLPNMRYEESEATLGPGDTVIFYSDGLVEAHDPQREMFGFPRLRALMGEPRDNAHELVDQLLAELASFVGADWEQEDDITLMTLQRSTEAVNQPQAETAAAVDTGDAAAGPGAPKTLMEFSIPSAPGNERLVMGQVAEAVRDLGLAARRLEGLKTAVAEATMNAMEHGNGFQADVPVLVRVIAGPDDLRVQVIDQGGSGAIVASEIPDLEAKLANLQTPRGWGLFLIKSLVDEMQVSNDGAHHTVDLILHLDR